MKRLAIATALVLTSCGDTIPDQPEVSAKADALAVYKAVLEKGAPCEAVGKEMARHIDDKDLVNAYVAADRVQRICYSVPQAIREIPIPTSVGKSAHAQITEALPVCAGAYSARAYGGKSLKAMIDGGGAIAQIAEVKKAGDAVQARTFACVGKFLPVLMALGVKSEDMGSLVSPSQP